MKTRMLPLLLAIAAVLGACGSSYDREAFIDEVTEGDDAFTDEQATCAADKIEEAGISWDRLDGGVDDVTAEDQEAVTAIFFDCLLGE